MDQNTQTKKALQGSVIMAVVSALVVLSTFGLEIRARDYESSLITTVHETHSSIKQIDAHRLYRIDADARVTEEDSNTILLVNGRIWLNTLYSGYSTRVKSGAVTITVPPSVSSLSYDGAKTTIEVVSRFAYVNIGEQTLYVPQGNGAVIFDSTIKNYSKELQQILPSKFFKQFSLYTISKTDTWYTQNTLEDEKVFTVLAKQFIEGIREKGARVSSDGSHVGQTFYSIAVSLKNALTVDDDKRLKTEYADALRYLDTALYFFNIGSIAEGNSVLSTFESKLVSSKALVQQQLKDTLDFLSPAILDPTFAPVRETVESLLVTSAHEKVLSGFTSLYDAARAAPSPEQKDRVISSLNVLSTLIEKNVASLTQKEATYVTELLSDLLVKNPDLMRDSSFRTLALLQDQSISRAQTKEIKVDTQQFFLSQKLDQLTTIKAALDEGRVDFQRARSAMIFIAQTIDLVKPLLSDSAFLPYFETRYKTIEPFISFLRSAETESLHGSYEKTFAEFKTKVRDASYITQLLNTATGGNGLSSIVREELGAIAAQDFAATALSDIRIAFDSNEDSSLVIITSSFFDGVSFSARYDTVRKLFTSIVFDGKEISNGVRLENLRTFLLVSRGKLSLDNNATAETLTEVPVDDQGAKVKAAVEVLKKKLSQSQISVDEKYIDTTGYEKGVIKVLLAIRGVEPSQKLFSFSVSTDLTTVSGLEVQTVLGQMPVSDTFLLKELAFRVDQMFERAAFEKSKEAEVQLLLDQSTQKPAK